MGDQEEAKRLGRAVFEILIERGRVSWYQIEQILSATDRSSRGRLGAVLNMFVALGIVDACPIPDRPTEYELVRKPI